MVWFDCSVFVIHFVLEPFLLLLNVPVALSNSRDSRVKWKMGIE